MKTYSLTLQMKAIEQYSPVVLNFRFRIKAESVTIQVKGYFSVVQGGSNF